MLENLVCMAGIYGGASAQMGRSLLGKGKIHFPFPGRKGKSKVIGFEAGRPLVRLLNQILFF